MFAHGRHLSVIELQFSHIRRSSDSVMSHGDSVSADRDRKATSREREGSDRWQPKGEKSPLARLMLSWGTVSSVDGATVPRESRQPGRIMVTSVRTHLTFPGLTYTIRGRVSLKETGRRRTVRTDKAVMRVRIP